MEENNYATNVFLTFIHPNQASKLQGFYTILTNQFPNLWCSCPDPITGPLQVSYTFKISYNSFLHGQVEKMSGEDLAVAKQRYQHFLLGQKCQKMQKCSYDSYLTNIIDQMIYANDIGSVTQKCLQRDSNVDVNDSVHVANPCTNVKQASSIPPYIEPHVPSTSLHIQIDHDISIPDKHFGFLNHEHPSYHFRGPDWEPVHIRTIEEHLHITELFLEYL